MELMAWKQGSWQRNGAQGCDHLAPGMILNRLSTFKLTEARRFNLQLPGYISLRRNGFPWRPPPGCHNRSTPMMRVRKSVFENSRDAALTSQIFKTRSPKWCQGKVVY